MRFDPLAEQGQHPMNHSATDIAALKSLLERVQQEPGLQQQFSTLTSLDDGVAQLAEHGIQTDVDSLKQFLKDEGLIVSDQSLDTPELTDADLGAVAGGVVSEPNKPIWD